MGKIFFGTVILALLFTRAGFWQLDRTRQKQNLAAAMEERGRLPPLRVSGAINKAEALRYRKVVAAGQFHPTEVRNRMEGRRDREPPPSLINDSL